MQYTCGVSVETFAGMGESDATRASAEFYSRGRKFETRDTSRNLALDWPRKMYHIKNPIAVNGTRYLIRFPYGLTHHCIARIKFTNSSNDNRAVWVH